MRITGRIAGNLTMLISRTDSEIFGLIPPDFGAFSNI